MYTIVSFSFLPLFITILIRLRRYYPALYQSVKWKIIPMLTFYFLVVVARLIIYMDFKNLHLIFKSPTIYATIPFYLTEILLAMMLSYVLFQVSKMEQHSNMNSRASKNHDDSMDTIGINALNINSSNQGCIVNDNRSSISNILGGTTTNRNALL